MRNIALRLADAFGRQHPRSAYYRPIKPKRLWLTPMDLSTRIGLAILLLIFIAFMSVVALGLLGLMGVVAYNLCCA